MASRKESLRKKRLRSLLRKYQYKLSNGNGTPEKREYWRYAVTQCRKALRE